MDTGAPERRDAGFLARVAVLSCLVASGAALLTAVLAAVMTAFLTTVMAAVLAAGIAEASPRDTVVSRVIDGDTFEIAGGAKVRVRNFDTPELRRYGCAEERRLAVEARDAARRLLQGAPVRLEISGEDRYRRLIADVTLRRGGERDFVDAMVENGHGARWKYGREPQPDWCTVVATPSEPADAGSREDGLGAGLGDWLGDWREVDLEGAVRDARRLARALENAAAWFE